MAQRLLLLFLLSAIFPMGGVLAEVKTFSKEMRRVIGENQSRDDARTVAIAEAKRQALEEAGTYLETLTVVKNLQVAKDDILALAAGVTRSRIVKEEPFLEGGAFGIWVIVTVSVDTATLDERIKKQMADRKHLDDLKASQARVAELLDRNKALEEKMNRLTGDVTRQEKQALQASFRENTRKLTAQEWYKKGFASWNLMARDTPQQAINYYSKAIELDPSYVNAYKKRGNVFSDLKKYRRAIEDFDHVIKLNPNYYGIYIYRGHAYLKLEQYRRAIQDFDHAISINPAYLMDIEIEKIINPSTIIERGNFISLSLLMTRGDAYIGLKQYQRAMQNYKLIIKIVPNYAGAYFGRGRVNKNLKKYRRAIEDFDHSIKIDPSYVQAYIYRGHTYGLLDQFRRAIEDFDHSIELDPQSAEAFLVRGTAYSLIGQHFQACQDWRKACDLGKTVSCELLPENKVC